MDSEEDAAAAAESWYQLPAEEDASAAVLTLSETAARGEHTDFPSVEEGTLLSEMGKGFSAGRTHSVLLEVQDSRLSPCLPLLTTNSTPGHKFFEDTLFQKTDADDFAPLRASLDMSEFPGPPKSLQMSDAVELASKEITMDQGEGSIYLSQHYLRTTLDDGGGLQQFSLHLGEKDYDKDNEPESAVLKQTSSNDVILSVVDKEQRSEDGAFLSSSVPAPVLLELLEKEVGMSSSTERSSRRSSKSSFAGGSENVHGTKQKADLEPQNFNTLEPDVHFGPKTISKEFVLEESFRDSSEVDFLKDVDRENEESNQSGITVRQIGQQSFQPLSDTLHKQLCSEIQQRYQDGDTSDITKNKEETIPPQRSPVLNKTSTELPNKTTVESHLRDELSMSSRCSIERGHKDTEISHTGHTPVDEASFIDRLPHPISQSTPGTFTLNRKPLSGRIQQIKAKLTGSDMSLNEEPSAETSAHNVAPSGVPQSIQSSQGYPESSDSQRSLSPQRRRIHSLPSLNYIEKVGAWNTNQSFDALVLRGLTGVSPKKLAYNAVADSLNRMLSRQTSASAPKKGLSASFKATSSMTNLNAAEGESSTISQITRSQSYNSVLPRSGENEYASQIEAAVQPVAEVLETTKSETSQSRVSLRSSSSTGDNVSKCVDKNTRSSRVGDRDLPTEQTSSRGQERAFDTSGNQSHNLVTMDRFSDVSFDQDYANSFQSSNHEKELLLASLASATHDLGGGGGNDEWSPNEETSGKEELDIEERIPTYLRNLGIDQSPTTILTPFAPKGPIREPEFSPTELRTIKGSTATPSKSMRLSEGGSQSAVNISQSSLYSSTSTTSVSIPMGSEVGPESPLPTEMSPPFDSGSANDRPISQDDTMTRGVGSDLGALSHHVQMSHAIQPIGDLNSSSRGFINEDDVELMRVKLLIEQFESGGYEGTTSHDRVHEQASSLQGYSTKPPPIDPVNDSFVGSKTLKEIQKLLAEDVGLDRTGSSLHRTSPVGDPYTEAPSRCLNLGDSLNSRSESPLDLQVKDMSWESSFSSSVTGDPLINSAGTWNKDSSSSVRDNSYLGELVGNRNALAAPLNQWGRSEPEGCSKATTNKTMPSTANVMREREVVDINRKVQRSEQLLSDVSDSVGSLKKVLAVTGTGYIPGKDTESDASSGDSLAARVTSLLKNATPLTYTAQPTQSVEDEERRARGSVKLKLTSHPMMPDTELSDEDRRRIEEIKRELLDRAKQAEKDYSHPNKRASSGDTGEFRLQLTPSPFQLPVIRSHDSVGNTKATSSSVQHMTKDVSSIMVDQLSPISGPYQEPVTQLHTQEAPRSANELERQNMPLVKSPMEATKPISSITFSSRKRYSPSSTSPDWGSLHSDSQVVFDKSPAIQSLDLGRPPVPLLSHSVHHIHHQDPPRSNPADKDADPAPVTSQQWWPDDSTTQEFSACLWAIDKEYSAAASIQRTPAPPVERFSTFPFPQKENVDPGHENVNLEGHKKKSNGVKDQLRPYSGLKAGGDGLHPSSPQELQAKTTISSPTRKALSCVHLTISPKEDLKVLDVSKSLVTLDTDDGSLAVEDTFRSSSANFSRNDLVLRQNDLSAGAVPLLISHLNRTGDQKTFHEDIVQFMGKENIPDRSIQSERRRSPLSDATTQITTESPQKTTFSAEIFVEGSVKEASTSSILKVNQTPERQMSSRTPLSCLSRATDQPLLLPYRPPGSPELFYVPVMEGGSRMSPVSTIESSHPGSNDAISPKFPPDVLGSATGKLSDPCIPRHREGIYSKEPSPKTADGKQKPARGPSDEVKSSQYQSSPAPRQGQDEKGSGSFSKMSYSTQSIERSDPRGPQPYPTSSLEEDEFLPLQPEIDYSQERSDINQPARSRDKGASEVAKREKTYPATSTDVPGRSHRSTQSRGEPSSSPCSNPDRSFSRSRGERSHSVVSNQSLDDLWARYTESRRRQTTESSNKLEVSLVERLERLARLLHNPPPRSLLSSKDENQQKTETKKSTREQWYRKKLGPDSIHSLDEGSVSKPYEDSPDSGSLHSEVKSTVTDSATTESQTASDASYRIGGSSSASTIDTIRLINAFGPERVLPSSRLSRLYNTIDLQKKCTEEAAKGSKRRSAARGQSKVEMQERQTKMADAESVASSNGFWEPSPALRQKKSSRGLNKGVQAGELEIVMSATRKNTRDVGTTFPSPGGVGLMSTTENMEANKRTSKSKVNILAPYIPAGLSWFVPVEDLKSESRKENEPRVWRGPGPAWYETVTAIKPWREPLREKNEQDRVSGRADVPIHRTGVIPEAQHKPFIRVTLQESLRSHRPDFIFRSGERVKRLQLLTEERKLQSVFQGQRDELFNQPPRGSQYKDSRLSQQSRTIPKKEMIQRSKRIYQQLPETRKRKEEEKRKSEYETYRLKAQLFRKKVTNHVLGRKTPWN